MNSYLFELFGIQFAISPQGIIANLILGYCLAEIYFWWRRANEKHTLSVYCIPIFQLAIIVHELGHALMSVLIFGQLPSAFRFIFLGGYTVFYRSLAQMSPRAAVLASLGGPLISALAIIAGTIIRKKTSNLRLANLMRFSNAVNIGVLILSLFPIYGDGLNIVLDVARSYYSYYDALLITENVGSVFLIITLFVLTPLYIWWVIKSRPKKPQPDVWC